ncbi:hypothetical protein [Acidipila rosea]|nr:hypothetical protein [Acidipila rosea]
MAAGATSRPQLLLQSRYASRGLGVVMPAPRALYFIYFPLLLLYTALAAWVLPTDRMLIIASLTGGLIGAYTLWDLLVNTAPFRVTNFLGMMLLVGYGLGAVNSWFTIDRAGITLGEFFNRDPAALTRAMAVILTSSAVLYCVGEVFEKPVLGEDFRIVIDGRSYFLIVAGTAWIILAYITGRLTFGGVASDVSQRYDPISALLFWIITPLFAYTMCVAFNSGSRIQKVVTLVCMLIQFAALIPLGRRFLTFSVLTGIFALRMGRRKVRLNFAGKVIVVAIFIGIFSFTSILFYYLRSVNGSNAQVSFVERVQLAMELKESRNSSEVLSVLQYNVERRTFILGYLSDLLDATGKQHPAMGHDFMLQIKRVIPSTIWSGKDEVIGVLEESLANYYLGFSYIDEANSILTAGALDFGVIGALLYPLLLCLVLRSYLEIVGNAVPRLVAPILVLAIVGLLFEVENELSIYFLNMRDGLAFAVLLSVYASIPRFRVRRA